MRANILMIDFNLVDPLPVNFELLPRKGETILFTAGMIKYSNGACLDNLYFVVVDVMHDVDLLSNSKAVLILEQKRPINEH